MTLKEIKQRLKEGAIIEQMFVIRGVKFTLISNEISCRLTYDQWIKIKDLLVLFKSDYSGITTHSYKLKQNDTKRKSN